MQGNRMGFCSAVAWRAALLWAVLLLVPVAPASADGLTLSVSPSNPTGITPITITATGGQSTPAGATVVVTVNPSDQPCPATPPAGNNQVPMPALAGSPPSATSGQFTLEHGSYTVCGWLQDPSNPPPFLLALTVANSDALSFKVPPPTATDGATTTLSLEGIADVQDPAVYVTRKPAAHAQCAASPSADSGTPISGFDPAATTFGSFTSSEPVALGGGPAGPDTAPPGSYLLCAWLMDALGSTTVPLAPPTSTTVTLTAPTGTLAYSLGGQLVAARSSFSITMSYATAATDVSLHVDIKRLPSHGRPCAATRAGDHGALRTFTDGVAGQSVTASARLRAPGVYVACAWLEWPHGTIDGPFAGRFVVAGRHQRATVYHGLTSQHIPRSTLRSSYPISFQVIDGQIVNLSYFARYTCTLTGKPPSHPIYSTSFPAFGMRTARRFGDTFVSGSDRSTIAGRVAGRRATGTLRESYLSDGYTCRSGAVRFMARRG